MAVFLKSTNSSQLLCKLSSDSATSWNLDKRLYSSLNCLGVRPQEEAIHFLSDTWHYGTELCRKPQAMVI